MWIACNGPIAVSSWIQAIEFVGILSLCFPLEAHSRERYIFVALLDCLFHDLVGMQLAVVQLIRVEKSR